MLRDDASGALRFPKTGRGVGREVGIPGASPLRKEGFNRAVTHKGHPSTALTLSHSQGEHPVPRSELQRGKGRGD